MSDRRYYSSYKHAPLLKRWLNAIFDFSIAGLVLFSLFIAYGILPNRWYHTLFVYSGSMSPTIKAGDVILISPPPLLPAPGSIVTLLVNDNLVTHRVIGLRPDGKFITKGDANIAPDEWGSARVSLVGVYRARVPYLGYVLAAIQDLLKVNASGAWFVDREIITLRASLRTLVRIPSGTLTPTPLMSVTPLPSLTLEQTGTPETPAPTARSEPTSTPTSLLAEPPTLLPISTPSPTETPTERLTEAPTEPPTDLPSPTGPPSEPAIEIADTPVP